MSGQNRIFLFLSCLLLVCCTGASTAKADCVDLVKQFNAAFSSRSLADVQALGTKIATDGGCDDLVIAKTQRARATLQFDQAKVLIKRGAPPSEYDALLADASKVLWDAAVQIGNDKSTQRQFVEATIAYERALELIKNEKLTPNQAAPDKKMIKAIFDSAAESRSLAANEESRSGRATYVPTAKDHRSGFLGGTMSISIRDFTPVTVPIPIRFETASSKFTENGQKAERHYGEDYDSGQGRKRTPAGHQPPV